MCNKWPIVQAKLEHVPDIMQLYESLSVRNERDIASYRNGGILKTPSLSLIEAAVIDNNNYFRVVLSGSDVVGLIFGQLSYQPEHIFWKRFERPGTWSHMKESYQEAVRENAIAYGADIMIDPNYQRTKIGVVLYQGYLNALCERRISKMLFMIEHVIAVSVGSCMKKNLNVRNLASVAFHKKLQSKVVKWLQDEFEICPGFVICRKCEYHLIDTKNSLDIITKMEM